MICQIITTNHYATVAARAIMQNYGYSATNWKGNSIDICAKYDFQKDGAVENVRKLMKGVLCDNVYKIVEP